MKRAIVVVLGDVGRSPRMCYHALSLADHGVDVEMVGYLENEPHGRIYRRYRESIMDAVVLQLDTPPRHKSARINPVNAKPSGNSHNGYLPHLMVQASKVKGARFIIDWHNYTHSILKASGRHLLALIACQWETSFGKWADRNFCVSEAMRNDLRESFGIADALTLYDKSPAWIFRPFNVDERHLFMEKFIHEVVGSSGSSDECRPFILVSCTSWTEDEDFGILIDALIAYDYLVAAGDKHPLPKLLVIITGKGPMKEYYLRKIQAVDYSNVRIVTAWIAAEDYPKLLASADLGVSLHRSTSGLDLPMKIVDMFGCHLPVAAIRFPAIDELVDNEENGVLFDTSSELATTLASLAQGFPDNTQRVRLIKKLDAMRRQLKRRTMTWEEQWDRIMWPVVESLITDRLRA